MNRLQCPVCSNQTNMYGQPFVSEWAVACHVAGMINHHGDPLHTDWAGQRVPGADLSLRGSALASELITAIKEVLSTSKSTYAAQPMTPLSRIHDIEIKLHRHIKQRLQAHFGEKDDSWWVRGIPLQIRQECVQRREADPGRDEAYAYTYLVDLKALLEKNWSLFETDFHRVRGKVTSKKELLDNLQQLNDACNRHSHPIRAPQPGNAGFEADLALARRVGAVLDDFCGSSA